MQDNTRNMILMTVLFFGIFLAYDYFYLRPKMEAVERYEAAQLALEANQTTQNPAAGGNIVKNEGLAPNLDPNQDPGLAPAQSSSAGLNSDQALVAEGDIASSAAGFVEIDSNELAGKIALRGARFEELFLKQHKISLDNPKPVQLLHPYGSDDAYYARFGWAGSEAGQVPDETSIWQADQTKLGVDQPVHLTWVNEQGVIFGLTIALDEHFMFTVTQKIENQSLAPVKLASYGLISRKGQPKGQGLYILHEGPFGVVDGRFSEYSYKDFDDQPVVEAPSQGGWVGLTDKYWMTTIIPQDGLDLSRVRFARLNKTGVPVYQASFVENWQEIAPGGQLLRENRLFAGAKKVHLIDDYADRYGIALFDRTIDWGWFYFLTRPIFFLLDLFNSLIGNFGVAIIALVLLLKLALYPLASRQFASMAHMKEAQPKIKALQERYKEDRVALQQEMMKLYKSEKINPLAGCLPLFPQIFIFFALYKVLYVTIEMRHAPFFGWIHDLSAPDPLTPFNLFGLLPFDPPSVIAIGIWPLLMGVTMYLQQRMSTTSMDPAQQKIMNLMPIVFTFILANFSAGLVVYWTLNSLLSVLQQWFITRRLELAKSRKTAADA